ncbi:MAG: hypothetical protein HKM95_17360 [Inquilinus sp.]|nr:hypothetical protein [Inquilinus sp.]
MHISQLLVSQGIISPQQLEKASAMMTADSGRFTDQLVQLGLVQKATMDAIVSRAPEMPTSIKATGLGLSMLLRMMLKAMAVDGLETPTRLAHRLALPAALIQQLMQDAAEKHLIESIGQSRLTESVEVRYILTTMGRQWAAEALQQSQYVGPVPVTLRDYSEQVSRQGMATQRVGMEHVQQAFKRMVMPDSLIRKLGPAVNSATSMLLYGAPGNGKTTIARLVGRIFSDVVFIPHCIEVQGQIIKIFDPSMHEPIVDDDTPDVHTGIRRDSIDPRWVPCRRPIIITGGELTLDMLDLKYNQDVKFYEAPIHMKALNGTFIVDDFGRQLVSPTQLLNRWIVPLENRIDYLKLHTGKSFMIPFDERVIFSTNLEPDDLMDTAFLRRIPYKLEIPFPTVEEYRRIFRMMARARDLDCSDQDVDFVIQELQTKNNQHLACYQPKFIIEQVLASCRFEGVAPKLARDHVAEALTNLYTKRAIVGQTQAAV